MTIEAELDAARAVIREHSSRIQQLTAERHEPIAIVGVGLRMPGGGATMDAFADYLGSSRSAIAPIPPDRWNAAEFVEGDGAGDVASASGGFLTGIDQFDTSFFNISPKEARCIDPQQRLALETSWEALENANIDPAGLRRGNVGVYFGASAVDYAWEIQGLDVADMEGYLAGGVLNAAVSGRVSYFLGARGPCMSIDTACSSSLVALHLAVNGLRGKECDLALCGGVSVIHHPYSSMLLTDMQALAPDGRCKTFDESADGYGRAEGCAVVALKRLSDAERDGDTVLALVRGTAVRQDGESAGFTAPNGIAQEALMRAALANAVLEPGDIQYVEAHGTGTPLGDPIEMASIAEVFGPSHSRRDPLLVASLKTNIGHMEAAAGIGGVVKTVLQLRSGTLVPHLNLDKPSSRIAWDTWPVRVPTRSEPWEAEVRRGLVNSFGFTGTIAAAVLEEAPKAVPPAPRPTGPDRESHVLTLSAKSVPALAAQLRRYQRTTAARPDLEIADLCYTTNVGRAHFRHRVAAAVTGHEDLAARLEEMLATVESDTLPRTASRKVGFLFSGLGQLRPGLGAGLYRRHPAFAEELDACDELLTPLVGRPVKEIVLGTCGPEDAEALTLARYGQPVQFAFEYALARLWMSWGVRPTAVAGHSMGEVVAGAVAGLFSLADAATLITARARLMDSVRTPGRMVSVGAGADAVAPLLAGHPDVAIAAINAPQQCVISGGRDSIAAITADLTAGPGFHAPPGVAGLPLPPDDRGGGRPACGHRGHPVHRAHDHAGLDGDRSGRQERRLLRRLLGSPHRGAGELHGRHAGTGPAGQAPLRRDRPVVDADPAGQTVCHAGKARLARQCPARRARRRRRARRGREGLRGRPAHLVAGLPPGTPRAAGRASDVCVRSRLVPAAGRARGEITCRSGGADRSSGSGRPGGDGAARREWRDRDRLTVHFGR
jgi:acyl transferase domain-containing protein